MLKSSLITKIKKLPKTPGVYIFYGKTSTQGGLGKAQVLYVGKATSLKSRVGSYFSGREEDRYISTAIGQIADIKIIETETVLEAFILEQDLIKRLQPKYNAMGKDDKSFTYVVVTKEDFPRFLILRKTELAQISPNRPVAHGALLANSPNYSNSPNLAYRQAGKIPNSKSQIKSKNLKTKNYQLKTSKIYGPYTSKRQIEIALKILRKIFPYHNKPQKTEKGCLDHQIGLCPGPYSGAITRADYLKNIRGIRMILEGKKKGLVRKLEKEMNEHSKKHEYEKAAEVRNKIFALKHIRDVALIARETPHPSRRLHRDTLSPEGTRGDFVENFRIEAYDISNISGQYAVGSMVVFDNSSGNIEANKNEYRKFKIKTIQGADDVGMMKEILTRRFNNDWPASTRPPRLGEAGGDSSTRLDSARLARGWPKPNLILLDGGVGHLHMSEEILKNLKLNITLAAVAKGPTRKISNFKFLISKQISMTKFSSEILKNKNLVKRIMDEAHRFAITYHKKIRKKAFIEALNF